MNERHCFYCGKPIILKEGQDRRRQYCNVECKTAKEVEARRLDRELRAAQTRRKCPCGNYFERPPRMSDSRWEHKAYCDQTCRDLYQGRDEVMPQDEIKRLYGNLRYRNVDAITLTLESVADYEHHKQFSRYNVAEIHDPRR